MPIIRQGDYVDYHPDLKTYITNPDNTGCFSQKFKTNTEVKWRVLWVDEANGKVAITTEKSANLEVALSDIRGYMRGPEELHRLCSKLYSSEDLGVKARCITVEDIKKADNFISDESCVKKYAYYMEDKGKYQYGDYVYRYFSKCYYLVDGTRVYREYNYYDFDFGGKIKKDKYGILYSVPTKRKPLYMTEKPVFRHNISNEIVKEILGNGKIWLASKANFVYNRDSDNVIYYMGFIASGNVNIVILFFASKMLNKYISKFKMGIRPVIVCNVSQLELKN